MSDNEKPLIVVYADATWSIGRVHRGIAQALSHKYRFVFHHDARHYMEPLLRDLAACSVCISTPNIMDGLARKLASVDRTPRCALLVFHYNHGDCAAIVAHDHFSQFQYATISRSAVPSTFPAQVHWLPSGVDRAQWTHRERNGVLWQLGWCGNLSWDTKRVDWAHKIAQRARMPLSLALRVPFERMDDWYASIDILLVTSGPLPQHETGPLPALEAIMCGVPVLGTAVGNFALVPGPKFDSIDGAAALLSDLREHPERVTAIAAEQHAYVLENFLIERVAQRWDAAIASICDSTGSSGSETKS